jgi:hypothetical protein
MTTVSIIPGAFANMIFYTVNIIFILVFYAVVFVLLICLYKHVHKKFGDDGWSDSIAVSGVIVPFALGSMVSMVLILGL